MASNGARNDAQLKNVVMPDLKRVVDYVVQKIWNENRELVRKIIYDGYEPVEYDRTGQFKEAWDTEAYITGDKLSTVESKVTTLEEAGKFDIRAYLKHNFPWVIVVLGTGVLYVSQYVKF